MISKHTIRLSSILCLYWLNIGNACAKESWQGVTTFNLLDEPDNVNVLYIVPIDDTVSLDWLTPTEIDVTANDNIDNNVIVSPLVITPPKNGITEIINNQIKYTPNKEFVGIDSFQYWLESANNQQISSTAATVFVNVNDINRGATPVAVNDVGNNVWDGNPVIIDVIKNDYDPDGNTLIVENVTPPSKGVTEIFENKVRYNPATGYCGTDSFTYTIRDSSYNRASATVEIKCTPPPSIPKMLVSLIEVNAAIKIQQDFVVLTPDTVFDERYTIEELRIQFSEEMGYQDLLPSVTKDTQYGYVHAFNSLEHKHVKHKNKILYLARVDDGTNKIDETQFRVINPEGNTSKWVTMRFSLDDSFEGGYDYYPQNDSFTVSRHGVSTLPVLENDPDVQLFYDVQLYRYPKHGSIVVSEDKKAILYTPKEGFTGIDSFKYKAFDELGSITSAPATVVVDVTDKSNITSVEVQLIGKPSSQAQK